MLKIKKNFHGCRPFILYIAFSISRYKIMKNKKLYFIEKYIFSY